MAVSNKIVFVTAIPNHEEPRGFIASANTRRCCDGNAAGRSAVVIRKMNSKLLIHSKWCSIQKSEEAWREFQDAVKDLLAIPKHNSIVLYSSDPPYHLVKDVFWLLNQPTISMNIYVSSINDTTSHQQLTTLPAKLASGNLPYCPRIIASDNSKMQNMSLTVAGLEAALAKTRQFCNELNCDVKNSVKEFTKDSEIDQLLCLANSIATNLQGQKTPSVDKNISSSQHIPDVPTGVALLPRSPCGIHVLWNPIRLDENDRNHCQSIIGYAVYVNGEEKVQTDGALNCQVILGDLEEEQQYSIQVCTRGSLHKSQLSSEVMYRHRNHSAVANDRQSRISSLHCSEHLHVSTSHHRSDDDIALLAGDHYSTGSSSRMDNNDACSQSSRTSGIEVDYLSPISVSAKTASSCKEPSPFSSSGNSSSYSDEHSFDGFLDGTPQLAKHYHENKKQILRSGPDPPLNIRVHPSTDGTQLIVSWTPVRRDSQGCNNGCRVLGYRVYVNNRAVASVDGPACFKTEIPVFNDDVDIYLCTRSIAGESVHSKVIKKAMSCSISGNSIDQLSTVTHSQRRHGKPCHSLASSRELLHASPAPQRIETYV